MASGAALKEPGVSREDIYDGLMALSDSDTLAALPAWKSGG